MSLSPKDLKLLWGKAASRCSMPECRKPLIAESSNTEPEGHNFLIGEMAHIIGEKNSKESARGLSTLPLDERNKYANLILLCPNDHTKIDKDEKAWPVERLHIIKREHELWVEEQLGEIIDHQVQIYHDFIDRVALALHLHKWEWTCDHLFRKIMHVDFPDGIYNLCFEHFRALFSGKDERFEESLRNLVVRSRAYLEHYLSDATSVLGDPRIMANRRYRDVPEHDYEQKKRLLAEHEKWDRNCNMLLFNLVHALNEFAQIVRSELRPDFFVRTGKFCAHDFMGLMGGKLSETWHLPKEYFSRDALNAPLEENT